MLIFENHNVITAVLASSLLSYQYAEDDELTKYNFYITKTYENAYILPELLYSTLFFPFWF